MMRSAAILAMGSLYLGGCATAPVLPPLAVPAQGRPLPEIRVTTSVSLDGRQFRMVQPDLVGVSKGFRLFGLITLRSASQTEALSRLYDKVDREPGGAWTIANVAHERTSAWYVLFSVPRVSVRADLVEFSGHTALSPGPAPVQSGQPGQP